MRAAIARVGLANGGDLARRGRSVPATDSPGPTGRAPVIVLATEHSGTERLRLLLDGLTGLACTSGTGVLPLCEQAVAVWRNADGRPSGQPSRLAVSSTRALADSIITSVLAMAGKRRWCEFSYALPETAETFAQLYPGTRFLCLYRSCGGVIRAVLDASPWGVASPVLAPFMRAYPASTAAAVAAYWIAHTSNLLAFEESHPQAVLRVRYEDLAAAGQETAQSVMSFLGVVSDGGDMVLTPDSPGKPDSVLPLANADLPVGLIPATLLAQTNNLLRQLDYPVLAGLSQGERDMSQASQDAPGTVIAGSGTGPEQGAPARRRDGRRKLWLPGAAGAIAAAGVTAALLTGSSSGPRPALAALTGALAKTSAESYSFSLVSTATYAGQQLRSDVVSGAYDPEHKLSTELLTRRYAQPSNPRSSARIRFIGRYVYTWVSPGAGFKTIGKPWDKAPLPATGGNVHPAGDLYGFVTDWPVSPDELVAVLRSTATARDSGPVSGPGWTGIRYTFTSRLGPQLSVIGTAYVDNQGRVRRLMTTTTRIGGVKTERDFTFSGFGAPVPVTAPPAAQARYTDKVPWGFFF